MGRCTLQYDYSKFDPKLKRLVEFKRETANLGNDKTAGPSLHARDLNR